MNDHVATTVKHGADTVNIGNRILCGTRRTPHACHRKKGSIAVGGVVAPRTDLLDFDVGWVKQQSACRTSRNARIDAHLVRAEIESCLARNLTKTAPVVSGRALGTAARIERAGEVGGVIRPDNHLAAFAANFGIRLKGGVGRDSGVARILNRGVLALVVATHENRAAAQLATGVHRGGACNDYGVAQQFDFPPHQEACCAWIFGDFA